MVIKKAILLLGLCAALCTAGCNRQQSDWEKTRAANTSDAYEHFLKSYPNGEFSAQASARLKDLYEERDWQKARDADTLEAYQAFLKDHPEGKWTEEARSRVENFTLATIPPASAAPAAAAPAAASASAAPAPAAPAAAPQTKAPLTRETHAAPKAGGAYGVQLGAFKTGADAANRRWARLQKEYPKLLSGLTPKVVPQKNSSGTLYRLQVPNLSEKHAAAICEALKAHSQGCFALHAG